jgi:hypothetical protein
LAAILDMLKVLSQPCEKHAEWFSRALDGPLPPGIRWGLKVHRVYCKGCKVYERQLQALRSAARALFAATEVPPAASSAAHAAGTAATAAPVSGSRPRAASCTCPHDVRERITRRLHEAA